MIHPAARQAIYILLAGRIAERRAFRPDREGWCLLRSEAERVAFHEAGHAVVGKVCQWTVDLATIVPETEVTSGREAVVSLGRVENRRPGAPKSDANAQTKHLTDLQRAARVAFLYAVPAGWRGALRIIHDLRGTVEVIVETFWPEIQLVAARLLQYKTLDEDQLDTLIGHRCKPPGIAA